MDLVDLADLKDRLAAKELYIKKLLIKGAEVQPGRYHVRLKPRKPGNEIDIENPDHYDLEVIDNGGVSVPLRIKQ